MDKILPICANDDECDIFIDAIKIVTDVKPCMRVSVDKIFYLTHHYEFGSVN